MIRVVTPRPAGGWIVTMQLARDRHHRDLRLARVDPHEQHLVGVRQHRRASSCACADRCRRAASSGDRPKPADASDPEPSASALFWLSALASVLISPLMNTHRRRGAERDDDQASDDDPPHPRPPLGVGRRFRGGSGPGQLPPARVPGRRGGRAHDSLGRSRFRPSGIRASSTGHTIRNSWPWPAQRRHLVRVMHGGPIAAIVSP